MHVGLESMRWFSHRRRTGGRHNCITYLLTDVVVWPTATFTRSAPEKMPHFVVFCPWWPWPLTQIRIRANFCTMHLIAKFHHPTFNRLEVIGLTNKLTNKQTDAAENIHLAPLCNTPVGKYVIGLVPELCTVCIPVILLLCIGALLRPTMFYHINLCYIFCIVTDLAFVSLLLKNPRLLVLRLVVKSSKSKSKSESLTTESKSKSKSGKNRTRVWLQSESRTRILLLLLLLLQTE